MNTLPDTPTQRILKAIGACLQARRWVGAKTANRAWKECQNVRFLRWWLSRADHSYLSRYQDVVGEISSTASILARRIGDDDDVGLLYLKLHQAVALVAIKHIFPHPPPLNESYRYRVRQYWQTQRQLAKKRARKAR
jgi:hypothetical protein